MKITKFVALCRLWTNNAVIAQKCPNIKVTVYRFKERIAKWNDPDVENIPVYEPGC
jgi:UDPglucose 6-dehydrogenase